MRRVARRPRPVGSGDEPSTAADRVRDLAPLVALVVVAVALLVALAVLPARTWWAQRQNMSATSAELDRLESEVEELRAELDLLQTDDEIERQARENFDLVYPGEESYRIIPEGSAP